MDGGCEVVGVGRDEGVLCDLSMFSTQISNLASLGKSRVANGSLLNVSTLDGGEGIESIYLAPDIRVKMGERTVAVAIGGNWLVMEMVHEWASTGRQVRERDRE